ncbi:Capsule polysaccharide export protein KpsE/RkpR [Rubrivivax sp. A210]|uniref:Wzz/FepE/Etk N-terminal domain-containing protein n=1 Tax=Rubrivivax sp. A210 TaxID=2772301 RepID=UPI0019A19802|nr:Wzz/FepE/Etk N-terminal domain-containing protein [Rubrivivax sp. A210]CAD5370693.1 Capsule polysaccharide export protein KpsE/RkpR [Rubrivivax sp. A210]
MGPKAASHAMNDTPSPTDAAPAGEPEPAEISILDLLLLLAENWKLLIVLPLLAGIAALLATYAITPTFTARTSFLPPQQQQSASASALLSLGALAGIAGGSGGLKSPADLYATLLQSSNVMDRLIEKFNLKQVYRRDYQYQVREKLLKSVQIALGKKDGLITVDVEDEDPKRAADLANAHVDELRRVSTELALTEAQQRRKFFGEQLERSKQRLVVAQQALQASGFSQGAIKTEPKAAADSFARLRAEIAAAEVNLTVLRSYLKEGAREVQLQSSALQGLRTQLAQVEQVGTPQSGPDYVSKYREFKYEETLFELMARQFETARVDESREGPLIQVIDAARPPERKSRPKRALTAVTVTLATLMLTLGYLVARHLWRRAAADTANAEKMTRIRASMRLQGQRPG